VTLVKQQARLRALDDGADLLLVDGPPGIGCPVIAALSGADLTLIVTEPTVSGAHDMERMLGVAAHFGIQAAVLINKADLSPTQSGAIEAACTTHGVPVVGRLPYDPNVTVSMVRGQPITVTEGPVSAALQDAWQEIRRLLWTD
jgi:MinD superfamily P-loop ATPase